MNKLLSRLESEVLMVLSGGSSYGFEISGVIERVTAKPVGPGALYPALRKLEESRLVRSFWGDEEGMASTGARRRYYEITDSGSEEVQRTRNYQNALADWKKPSLLESVTAVIGENGWGLIDLGCYEGPEPYLLSVSGFRNEATGLIGSVKIMALDPESCAPITEQEEIAAVDEIPTALEKIHSMATT